MRCTDKKLKDGSEAPSTTEEDVELPALHAQMHMHSGSQTYFPCFALDMDALCRSVI